MTRPKHAPSRAEGATPRRRSGPNIPEHQRGTVSVKLRVSEWHRDKLRELSESDGHSMSRWVETWIEMQARGEI
jgi:hypothetical protein